MSEKRASEVSSPQCWGFESPSQLNREVSSILSRGNPPPDDERHKWTHPSPVQSSARPVSCPISAPGAGGSSKKFSAPLAVSPFQLTDQSQELRNHLYQTAYQHHSPFRFPFLPVNRYFPALPPSPLRLPYPFPYPSYPPYPLPDNREAHRESPVSNKRKYNEEPGNTNKTHQSGENTARTQSHPNPGLRVTTGNISYNNQPPYFRAGSMIQLASGNMKKVEDLSTEDFVSSAASCPDISLEEAIVTKLESSNDSGHLQVTFSLGKSVSERVTVSISPEHPFFVTGQGWSSSSPSLSMARFRLDCRQLSVGDVCISLRPAVSESSDRSHKQVRFQDCPVPPATVKRKRLSSSPLNINVKVSQVPLQHSGERREEERGVEGGSSASIKLLNIDL